MDPDLQAPIESQLPDALPSAGDRYADLLLAPQGERVLSDLVPGGDRQANHRQVVPTVTGVGPLGKLWPA